MSLQPKFVKGDYVSVARRPLGWKRGTDGTMEPFGFDEAIDEAIILHDCEKPNPGYSYAILRPTLGFLAWIYEEHITLIEPRRLDLLAKWEDEMGGRGRG